VAHAALGLRHVHRERGVEAAAHEAGDERGAELRVPGMRRGRCADARALERLADVDGERREVGEVEALELVVAEDDDGRRA
jgi:hypothetical protein